MQDNDSTKIKNGRGQILGVVQGKILRIIKHTSHIVRKFNGIGVSLSTLEEAQRQGAEIVEFAFFENNDTYRCLIGEYLKWAHRDTLSSDAGMQLFLAFKSFKHSVLNRKPTVYDGEWVLNRVVQIEMFG